MAREQTSKERSKGYVEALEEEMRGYKQKLKGAELRKDTAMAAIYDARTAAVKAEITRAKKEGQTPTSNEEVEADTRSEEEHEESEG